MNSEKLKYAKEYISKMANGINPVTNEKVGDNDSLNDIHISRCLFFVEDILKNYKPKKTILEDFCLTKNDIMSYDFSDGDLPISKIVKKINEFVPLEMKKLKVTELNNWLVEIGLLKNVLINGRVHREPTNEGKKIGLSLEFRNGLYANYYIVMYNINAQSFIIQNFDNFMDYKSKC